MKRFVFWTGMISIFSGLALQLPAVSARLMPSEGQGMLMHLFGAMAIFLGVMLGFCSRDLEHRGTLVAWEAILRLGGFGIMGGYGVLAHGGVQLVLSGAFDLLVGIAYLIWLPRYLGVPLKRLLFDEQHLAAVKVEESAA